MFLKSSLVIGRKIAALPGAGRSEKRVQKLKFVLGEQEVKGAKPGGILQYI